MTKNKLRWLWDHGLLRTAAQFYQGETPYRLWANPGHKRLQNCQKCRTSRRQRAQNYQQEEQATNRASTPTEQAWSSKVGQSSIPVPSQKNMQQLLLACRASVQALLAVCCTELPNDVVFKIVVLPSNQTLVPTSGMSHCLCTSFPGCSLESQC